ncbi:MAG: YihY/virulence factor BrkB family protein [Chloroflexota bacterium]
MADHQRGAARQKTLDPSPAQGPKTLLSNPRALLSLLKETYGDWSEDKASRLAAALAYYTAFSVAPLLLISIVVAGLVFGREAAEGQIFGQLQGMLGSDAAGVIQTSVANSQKSGASALSAVVGLATLIWSASSLFSQLQEALNTVWEVAPDPHAGIMATVKRRFLSMTMVLGIAFVLLVSLVLSAGIAAVGSLLGDALPGGAVVWQGVNFILSFALVTGLFAAIYKVLPDATVDWSDVWIGAAVTALLFTIGKLLIGLYLGHASIGSTFGAAGSLLVFLVWVYYSAQILFFGAELTQVYARQYGSRITPSAGAISLSEEARADQGIPHAETVERAAAQQKDGRAAAVVSNATPAGSTHHRAMNVTHVAGRQNGNGTASLVADRDASTAAHDSRSGSSARSNGATAGHERRPGGNGGTKGAPDAVKKLMWAGVVSGTMAVGSLAARRASAEIWRVVFHEDPPTKDV